MDTATSTSTYSTVDDHYSALARDTTSTSASHSQKIAISFGYSADELSEIPEGANLGVSCGNPLAVAGLREVSFILFKSSQEGKMRRRGFLEGQRLI
jgi:arsenite methyltransferase